MQKLIIGNAIFIGPEKNWGISNLEEKILKIFPDETRVYKFYYPPSGSLAQELKDVLQRNNIPGQHSIFPWRNTPIDHERNVEAVLQGHLSNGDVDVIINAFPKTNQPPFLPKLFEKFAKTYSFRVVQIY